MPDDIDTTEMETGLRQARDAILGRNDPDKITRKQIATIAEAVIELAQHFSAKEMLVLGTYVAAMARQSVIG